MKTEIILLFFINICSAIGYSLIAPLYPYEALKRDIKEKVCGFIISMFAVSNFFATPFCPALISKYGRKQIFYFAVILEAICTFAYGLLYYIPGYYSFLFISVVSRFAHGIGSSFSATLVYSVAASICDPSQLKITIGLMELAWCLGIAIGPLCASIFYYIGGYVLPYVVCALAILICIPLLNNLNLSDDEEGEVPQFMTALWNPTVISIIFTVIMDMFTKTFYYPTFTNHLVEKFGLSIEGSSMFFVINISSYFVVLQYINVITNKFGLKMTLVTGLFLLFIGSLFLAPISILPQSMLTIMIGLVILGIPAALINVSSICDLIEFFKTSKLKMDDATANDISSAIYNLGLNFGEAVGPIFGGYVTEKIDFETSCVYTSLLNLFYCIFFFMINYQIIQNHFHGKFEPLLDESTGSPRKLLTDDETDYQVIKPKDRNYIDKDRQYVGRYRSYSYNSRGSKRSSITNHNLPHGN